MLTEPVRLCHIQLRVMKAGDSWYTFSGQSSISVHHFFPFFLLLLIFNPESAQSYNQIIFCISYFKAVNPHITYVESVCMLSMTQTYCSIMFFSPLIYYSLWNFSRSSLEHPCRALHWDEITKTKCYCDWQQCWIMMLVLILKENYYIQQYSLRCLQWRPETLVTEQGAYW